MGVVMYRFTRSATLLNATVVPQAIGWTMELNGYLNKTYKVNLKAGMEMFGSLKIHWEMEIDSLDKLSEINTKLIQDKTYFQMLEKGKEFWVNGSVQDCIVNFPQP
jgi:hypothetical protein